MTRRADVKRQTAETSILVSMDLDGTGKADIRTGIGFFDHMLHQIARHGQIDLTVMCDGDLHIDGHHSVEDIGIAMGQCLAKALGDKAGITRFGSAYVPLDEALSRTVLDISGRPYLVWNVDFTAAMIGEFPLTRYSVCLIARTSGSLDACRMKSTTGSKVSYG